MKILGMKSLSLAVLAIAGLGLAGTASAACSNPTPFAAWSSWNGTSNAGAQFGGATASSNGLNGTTCGMAASSTQTPGSNGMTATVYDNSPAKEQTYRFRFYIDPTAVVSHLSTFNSSYIFQASSSANHGANAPTNRMVGLVLRGNGTDAILVPFAACTTPGSGATQQGNLCSAGQVNLPTPFAGTGVRVEGQLVVGGAGTGVLNIWVGANVGTPNITVNVDNAAWGTANTDGVKQAVMGLLHTSQGFRAADQNLAVIFDEFDSRRQTAIGP
jgi:hypothetical protein